MPNRKTKFWIFLICLVCLGLCSLFFYWQHNQLTPKPMNSPLYSDEPAIISNLPEYRFAVHPLHNPQRLFANFQPVVDLINKDNNNFSVRLLAGRDYASFEKKIIQKEVDFALANPLQTLMALEYGYEIVAKMGDDDNFRGIIIARKDSGIEQPTDLNGKNMIFPAPTALAATLMPRYFLYTQGVDMPSIRASSSGSQESAIMNVYLGNFDAAGTWPMPWELFIKERPELAKEMKVLWSTQPLINNAIIARKSLPKEHVDRFVKILTSLDQDEAGRICLEHISLSRFDKADNEHYVPVVNGFLKRYQQAFPDNIPSTPTIQANSP